MSSAETCQRITYAVANGPTKFCGKPAVVVTVTGTLLCKEHRPKLRQPEQFRLRRNDELSDDAMRWRSDWGTGQP